MANDVIELWEISAGKLVQPLAGYGRPVSALAFSPSGSLVASATHLFNLMVSPDKAQ